jgi:DNA-binding HxlR family transcriptional regulator
LSPLRQFYANYLHFASSWLFFLFVDRRSECPIAYGLDVFGDKWSLLIVRDIAIHGQHHYRQFEEAGEGIATNILAGRLKRLVEGGIVEKVRDPEHGSRRIYRLTHKGLDLLPIIIEIIVWSAKHDPDSPVTKDFLRRATDDRESLLAEMRATAMRA